MDGTVSLVDHIYEAALIPDRWPSVLDEIAALCDAPGGLIIVTTPDHLRWTGSESLAPVMERYVAEGWMERNRRIPRAAALDHAGFLCDFDLFTPEEIEEDPMYARLRASGLGWCVGTLIPLPQGDGVVYTWERSHAAGPFGDEVVRGLDGLRPHLARAGILAARLGLERAQAAAASLALLGLPAAVLSRTHRLLAANDLCQALIPAVLCDRRERVRLAHAPADALLGEAFAALDRRRSAPCVASVPVPASDGGAALVAHLVPVRGAARDVFSAACSLLVLTPVKHVAALPVAIVRGLFDLTAAEARVAHAVADGERIEDIAAALGLSPGTIRTQLKSVFAKTGVSRQVELANLLRGFTPC